MTTGMPQWRTCAQRIKVNRRELEDNVFQLSWEVFWPKLVLDDLYGQGYWVLKDGARRYLFNAGSNVSEGGMTAEL